MGPIRAMIVLVCWAHLVDVHAELPECTAVEWDDTEYKVYTDDCVPEDICSYNECCDVIPKPLLCGAKVTVLEPISFWGRRLCRHDSCPDDFVRVGSGATKSCLVLADTKENYDEAKAYCDTRYGGHLVTGEDDWRRDNINQFVEDNTIDADEGWLYIGAKENQNGRFAWDGFSTDEFWDRTDDTVFSEFASTWRNGEPDNSNNNERCVCPQKGEDGWSDCKCYNAKRPFICEIRCPDGTNELIIGTLPIISGTLPIVSGTLPIVSGTLPINGR